MLIDSSSDEVKRRDNALKIIGTILNEKGKSGLFDLTGLSGGFPLEDEDLGLIETYAGPALFEEQLTELGIEHLGGEKVLAFNRTTSGIFATILALVKPGEEIVHFLPKSPSHPSIPRSAAIVNAVYKEFDDIDKFTVTDNTSLVIITGSTMDHEIIKSEEFDKVVEISKSKNIPIFVDDASGASLRTIIHKQPNAIDLGADMVIKSTDKLIDGPRGGLMAGKTKFIDKVKSKSYEFGLEAQPPVIAGMVRTLEKFTPHRIFDANHKKNMVFNALKEHFKNVKKTPTGIMLSADGLINELEKNGHKTVLSAREVSFIFAMILLKNHNIITIPAVGMPGASATIRIDLASKDAEKINTEFIVKAFIDTFNILKDTINDLDLCESFLFN
ncbi:MAG: TIGR03576 family pyridoxal phosphate-dependent enzyme [Methanobacteriaceae archaeon]|nr:TIGR03576 family pyridoxal phosphate-dependent enzyme [Methanobacteriaceae archaeon]